MPLRLLALGALLLVGGTTAALAAQGRAGDGGVLNETDTADALGDSGGGPDLAALTVTTYADGTASFAVRLANRDLLHLGETIQIFVDLDDNGRQDLNLSLWPNGEPSFLARWTGSDWVNVRQLPELARASGSMSARLRLGELQDAAGVPTAASIGVAVVSAVFDQQAGGTPSIADSLPDDQNTWIQHRIQAPQTTTPTTTATTPAPPPHRVPAKWRSCAAVHRRYPHGIGRAGAHDRTRGKPVTTFRRSTKLYEQAVKANPRLDPDHDGIACEQAGARHRH
jgi:hypothetical protein